MGKTKSSKFKSIASKVSKGVSKASKAAVPLAYAAKYNKEIAAVAKFAKENMPKGSGKGNTLETLTKGAKGAAKAAKFIAKNADKVPWSELGQAGKEVLKDPNVQKYILEKAGGYAVKKGEKALDKKFGDKKGYRIAKAGTKLLYNVGTGNVGGAVKNATDIYGEADPNKKRVAKVKAYSSNIQNLASSAMSGDYQGALQAGMNTYALADPNKKRVAKVQKYSNKALNTAGALNQMYGGLQSGDFGGALSGGLKAYGELDPNKKRVGKIGNYVSGAADIYNAANDVYNTGTGVYGVSQQNKMQDAQAITQTKSSKKVNSALAAGSNIQQHKSDLIAAHEKEDYGSLAAHAKMLHQEAKKANKLQIQSQTGTSYYPVGGGSVKPKGIMPMEGQGKYMNQGPIGVSSMKSIGSVAVNPIGGSSKKPI